MEKIKGALGPVPQSPSMGYSAIFGFNSGFAVPRNFRELDQNLPTD